MSQTDPVEQNILGVQQLVSSKLNKALYAVNQQEGINDEFEDEFTLKMSDEELLALSRQWENEYRTYEAKIKARQEQNKTFYTGGQKEGGSIVDTQSISGNLIFEAEETFLPAALSKNPEPVVFCDNTTEGIEVSKNVKTMLQYHADILALRRKLTLVVRHWSIYFIGVMKHGWDEDIEDIKSDVRDPRNFILDPNGYVDCYGDFVGYIGERIKIKASKLIELFPQHKAYITIICNGRLGTEVTYTEWWDDDYCFYTFKDKVLDKNKNPHFNYEKDEPLIGSDGQAELDETGKPLTNKVKGNNHFGKPKKPYTFLSVFSLGEQPHDITGLIEQNIPNQRRITRRIDQIDFNLSRANNSDVFSENNFNQETAKQAANGMAKGHPILVPSGGPIDQAIHRLPAPAINDSFFKELEVSKNDLRSIFGVEGISAQNKDRDETARGMILQQSQDTSRIGGGIGDAIEQFADNVFNWWAQLYYVYYDETHYATVMGRQKAVEYVTLSSQDLNRRLVVSVTPDSMKPKDELSEMNQATQLYQMGALDPKTLLTMLNVPDPQKTAESTVLWLLDKQAYLQINFPEVAQQLQQIQQQMMAQQNQQALMQGEQQMQQEQQKGEQGLNQAEASHQQKLRHGEESHQQKLAQAPPKTISQEPASASLSNVKLPSK